MAIEVRAATVFEDVATVVGAKKPTSNVCWCLSYRLPDKENLALHDLDVGTRRLFEKGGFHRAADTDSVLNGFPRVLMRRELR